MPNRSSIFNRFLYLTDLPFWQDKSIPPLWSIYHRSLSNNSGKTHVKTYGHDPSAYHFLGNAKPPIPHFCQPYGMGGHELVYMTKLFSLRDGHKVPSCDVISQPGHFHSCPGSLSISSWCQPLTGHSYGIHFQVPEDPASGQLSDLPWYSRVHASYPS